PRESFRLRPTLAAETGEPLHFARICSFHFASRRCGRRLRREERGSIRRGLREACVSWAFSSLGVSRDEFDALDAVPEIPAGIPDRLVGLRVSFFVGGARHQGVLSGRSRRPLRFPGTEGIRPVVLAKRRFGPTPSAIA